MQFVYVQLTKWFLVVVYACAAMLQVTRLLCVMIASPPCSIRSFLTYHWLGWILVGSLFIYQPSHSASSYFFLLPEGCDIHVVVMKPSNRGSYAHSHFRGHVTAYPNPGVPAKICGTFPMAPSSLPEYVNVVFTTPCTSDAEVRAKLHQSKMWQVR